MKNIKVITTVVQREIKNRYSLDTKKSAVHWSCPECGAALGEIRKVDVYGIEKVMKVDTWDAPCGHAVPLKYFKKCNRKELIDFYIKYDAPMNLQMKSFNPKKATKEEIIEQIDKKQIMNNAVNRAFNQK